MKISIDDKLDLVEKDLRNRLENFIEEATSELESQIVKNTAVDEGELKLSWEHRVDKVNLTGIIGSSKQNAIWEEYGTGNYAVNDDGRKTPWYIPVDEVEGTHKPTYKGEVTIVYGKNGMAFYKTDGKRAKRMVFQAYSSLNPKIQRRLKEIMKR